MTSGVSGRGQANGATKTRAFRGLALKDTAGFLRSARAYSVTSPGQSAWLEAPQSLLT
jgi:hypothetical protein